MWHKSFYNLFSYHGHRHTQRQTHKPTLVKKHTPSLSQGELIDDDKDDDDSTK